jgi:hypothetical protein
MSFYSFGGPIAHWGFAVGSALWLFTAWQAYAAVRRRDFASHRAWMVRNFALAFAAVTLRIQLGAGFGLGLRFEDFYPWLAWASWVPNLLVAELVVAFPGRRAHATVSTHAGATK